jgi:multifunctional 2-oxoglutarate metabolism enzyme
VDELYQQYLADKNSVDAAWWDFFKDYRPTDAAGGPVNGSAAAAGSPPNGAPTQQGAPARGDRTEGRRRPDGRAGCPGAA